MQNADRTEPEYHTDLLILEFAEANQRENIERRFTSLLKILN